MVYMTFPKQLTEQEEELQRKFAQLRKLKKQVASLKASAAAKAAEEEAEKQNKKKRALSEAAEAATEHAKKLLQSGQINIGIENKRTFKRPRTDRPVSSKAEKTSINPVGYEPYSQEAQKEAQQASGGRTPSQDAYVPQKPIPAHVMKGHPPRGPRIYVRGEGVNKALLLDKFSEVGTIIDVYMESGKCSGFVTFDAAESADEAVSRFNGTVIGNGVKVDVEIARRQDGVARLNRGGATPRHRKSSEDRGGGSRESVDKRDMVNYGDDDMFS